MARFTVDRRALLRGASGVAIGLPFLEIMGAGEARAGVAPPRFVILYAGISQTRDGPASGHKYLSPTRPGAGYDLPADLSPLGTVDRKNSIGRTFKAFDVQNEVSLVTGLKIPWGMTAPSDGRPLGFH